MKLFNLKERREWKIFLILLVVMLISTNSVGYAATYSDVEGTKYQEAVETLANRGVVSGYVDGTYLPLKNVTRAEFAALITRYLGISESALSKYSSMNFKDMAGYAWATGYISYCSEKGIITGDGNGNAMPGKTINYAQAQTMIVRALGFETELDPSLGWPANYLEVAKSHGMTEGITTASGDVNRGNAALLLYNALNDASVYSGNVTVNILDTYRAVGGELVKSDAFARNLDSELFVKFSIKHELVASDAALALDILISPVVENKVIESKTSSFKLLAGTEETLVMAGVSISDLVKDNYNVNKYKIEIRSGNNVFDVETIELYVDTAEEQSFMGNATVKGIKFFSGNNADWIEAGDRVYGTSFLKTPVLSVIGTEVTIHHDPAKEGMWIPVNFVYEYKGQEFCDSTYEYFVSENSTETVFDFQVYYSQYQAKKYQVGSYTVSVYSFGKLIANGKFEVK